MWIQIVINTGRTYVDAELYSNFIGLQSPVIACNGAIIKEKDTNDAIYKSIIHENLCIGLLEAFKKYKVKSTYSTINKLCCSSLRLIIFMEYLKFKDIKNKCIKLDFTRSWNKWLNIFRIEKDNIIKCEITDRSQ